jgi:HEAT repeat protein
VAGGSGRRPAHSSPWLGLMSADDISRLRSLLTSGDDDLAENAVTELASLGSQAIPSLKEMLSAPEGEARWWATRALAEIHDPQVIPLLMDKLDDPDESVCQCAALALRQQPAPEAVPHLVELLGNQDRLLAHLASDALVAIGKASVPALVDTIKNSPPAARLEAFRALARIGDPDTIPVLFSAYEDDSALMEFWADEGLERMGVGMIFFKP